jgi:tetratricopeptide (TPR) repeat protein
MKFVAQLYVSVYLLAGITSGLSGNPNFVLNNFNKSADLSLFFLSKKRNFYAEAQYLFARAITALEHTPQGGELTLTWQSIFRLKQAITYFTNTLRLAEDFNFPWLQIKCLIGIADAYFDLRSVEEAEYILEDAIERAEDMRDKLIDFLLNYGDERTRLVDPEIASIYFSKAVGTAFSLKDLNLISKTLTKHGHVSNIDEFIEQAIELAEKADRREFVVHFKMIKEKRKIPQKPFKYSFDNYTDVDELPDDLQNWMVFSRIHKLDEDHNILVVCWNGKIGSNLAIYETEDRLRDLLAIKSLKMIKLDEGDYKIKDAPDSLKKEYRIHALIQPGNDAKVSVKTEQETFVISI